MDKEQNKMAERVLHLTLEILFQLTGEDYKVVKKTSSDRCRAPECEGLGRTLSPILGPPPHLLIHEDINVQKILQLTNRMMELLTGEVPIKCQDVNAYSSTEEWEYLEAQKDLYEDVMMEDHKPLTSSDGSSKKTPPERCPRPLLPQDHQDKDLTDIKATEINVRGEQEVKEEDEDLTDINTTEINLVVVKQEIEDEIPIDNHPDDCTGSSAGHLISADCKTEDCDIIQFTYEEDAIISDIPSALHSNDLSSDPFIQGRSSGPSQLAKQNNSKSAHTGEKKAHLCLECGKYFTLKSNLVKHQKSHLGEKPFSCPECSKCFTYKSVLVKHQKIHTGEKPFSCLVCGKCFIQKHHLVLHQNLHTGEKPHSCSECGKCFALKSNLVVHQKSHGGEKPFSCSECGKCFNQKHHLVKHQRVHTGEKPYSCSECGKRFSQKHHLVKHQRIHTGEKPFSCSECGKCFPEKSVLVKHQKIHTGEKPFSCSECGKCFTYKSNLIDHQKIHTRKKPF